MTAPTAPAAGSPPPLNAALLAITAGAVDELAPLWQLNPADIAGALMDVLPALVDRWGLASASAAADWYDQLRESQGISGRFTAIVPPMDHLGAEALAGWGAQPLRDAKSIVAPAELPVTNLDVPASGLRITTTDLVPQEPGPRITTVEAPTTTLDPIASAQYRVEGGLQKRLVNAANLTVTHSAAEDPQARGYMRRTRPGACGFCKMVASRGGVFTKATSTFACHEHCYCESVPAWGGKALPVGPYKPSDRPSTPEDRARVRKWIADNLDNEQGAGKKSSRRNDSSTRIAKATESKKDIAARQLPGLEKSLANLRKQGLSEDSPQIQYHLKTIARLRADLGS